MTSEKTPAFPRWLMPSPPDDQLGNPMLLSLELPAVVSGGRGFHLYFVRACVGSLMDRGIAISAHMLKCRLPGLLRLKQEVTLSPLGFSNLDSTPGKLKPILKCPGAV